MFCHGSIAAAQVFLVYHSDYGDLEACGAPRVGGGYRDPPYRVSSSALAFFGEIMKKLLIAASFVALISLFISIYRIRYIENIIGLYPNTASSEYFFPFSKDRQVIARITTKDDIESIKKFYKHWFWFEGEWDLVGESKQHVQFERFIQENPGGSPVQGKLYSIYIELGNNDSISEITLFYSQKYQVHGDM